MSYKKLKEGTDEWWEQKIKDGIIKCRPGLGSCMFCLIKLTSSLQICQKCLAQL